jgi:hypothetical protein
MIGSVLPHWKFTEKAHSILPCATEEMFWRAPTRLLAPNTCTSSSPPDSFLISSAHLPITTAM